jgi:hypothetical protein
MNPAHLLTFGGASLLLVAISAAMFRLGSTVRVRPDGGR